MSEPIRCAAWCEQYPNCQHDWSTWERITKPVEASVGRPKLSLVPQPPYSLTGLSERHIELLQDAFNQVSLSDPDAVELQKIIYGERN